MTYLEMNRLSDQCYDIRVQEKHVCHKHVYSKHVSVIMWTQYWFEPLSLEEILV